jgi:transketolase
VQATKRSLGWPADRTFFVPEEARHEFQKALERGKQWEGAWQGRLQAYASAFPEDAARWEQYQRGTLPPGWDAKLPAFGPADKAMATRAASGKVLDALTPVVTNLVGGSADLTPSNNTRPPDAIDFQPGAYGGRYFRFGVREHAMGSISNGLALHGGVRPYGATFLVFSDYMRPALRLAALMQAPVVFIFTHDSVGLGEDGPTHQPIEHLMALRAIPGLRVIRPADAAETVDAWKVALSHAGPTCLILTRQNVPNLDRSRMTPGGALERGAYILSEPRTRPDLLLLATGSEVHVAIGAQQRLDEQGVAARVVSMPCWELFDQQPQAYRDEVLPPGVVARVAVEAGSPLGWYKYIGSGGRVVGMTRFGASAPGTLALTKFGFTPENVAEHALAAVRERR